MVFGNAQQNRVPGIAPLSDAHMSWRHYIVACHSQGQVFSLPIGHGDDLNHPLAHSLFKWGALLVFSL